MVVKPDENGVRGGRVVTAPLTGTRPGMVYQRLVDSRGEGRIRTLRPMVFDGRVLVVYTKARPEPNWFVGREEVGVLAPDAVLSADEQSLLLRFCAAIALDYGELDVIRDNESGLIYVVDANRTPIRPRGLAVADEDAAFGPFLPRSTALKRVSKPVITAGGRRCRPDKDPGRCCRTPARANRAGLAGSQG